MAALGHWPEGMRTKLLDLARTGRTLSCSSGASAANGRPACAPDSGASPTGRGRREGARSADFARNIELNATATPRPSFLQHRWPQAGHRTATYRRRIMSESLCACHQATRGARCGSVSPSPSHPRRSNQVSGVLREPHVVCAEVERVAISPRSFGARPRRTSSLLVPFVRPREQMAFSTRRGS
jgi:hypothetical protein